MLKKWLQSIILASFLIAGTAFSADKININTASSEQLQTLHGIGKATANAIIDFRKSHGKFSNIDELLQVKGIGKKKLNQLSPYITVKD